MDFYQKTYMAQLIQQVWTE